MGKKKLSLVQTSTSIQRATAVSNALHVCQQSIAAQALC